MRALTNALREQRLHHAYLFTGTRGVGKTTLARIIAKALNCETGVTDAPCGKCGACTEIDSGRFVDLIELDAASNTQVDNMRELLENAMYAPSAGRYKVYFFDEVHMLSRNAFNAMLKTLEEPPEHVKFVLATTDPQKIPVTVLSRCLQFNLKQIPPMQIQARLQHVLEAEGIASEPAALALIARAAQGSLRDALSLLDQAIAHGAGVVSGDTVRDMLGLADRSQVIDLFEAVMRGDVPATFALLRAQYDSGADPAVILTDLAAFTHVVTRLKLVPDAARDPALTESERERGGAFARALSVRTLSRAWQILLKGIPEVQASNRPIAAAEMVLVRLCYAAELPPPDEALRLLKEGAPPAGVGNGGSSARSSGPSSSGNTALAAAPQAASVPRGEPAPGARLRRLEDVAALAGERREIALKSALARDVRLVRFEEGRIEFNLTEGASRNLANELKRFLDDVTGRRWAVALSSEPGAATLYEERQALERERKSDAAGHPLVQAVLNRFPGAQIVDVRTRGEGTEASDIAAAAGDPEADEDT